MSEIIKNVSIPLDDERFLRRECPHCVQEFKIQISPEDLKILAEKGIETFLTDDDEPTENEDIISDTYNFCPYCGQEAPNTHWWTQEQLSYFKIYAKNILSKIVNEQLIKPMNRNFNKSSGIISISFKGSEMKYEEPWISSEINDMTVFNLPCCNKNIKIVDSLHKNVFCFYCGYEHKNHPNV